MGKKLVRPTTKMVYGNRDLSIEVSPDQIWELIKVNPKSVMIKRDNLTFRISRHNYENLWEPIEGSN